MENDEVESKEQKNIINDDQKVNKTPIVHSISSKENNLFFKKDLLRLKTLKEKDLRSSSFTLDVLYRKKKEKELLQSIKNLEDITKEKMQLAETIEFKNIPDGIVKCDEYGFLLNDDEDSSSKESNDEKCVSNKNVLRHVKEKTDNLLTINARIEKWNFMLNNFKEFQTDKFKKLKSRTRKGIPDNLRGYVWQKIAGAEQYDLKNLYQDLENEPMDEETEKTIMRDLDRTYPNCYFFRDKYGNGQRKLLKVLSNYSKYNKNVGYMQGMAFICALLLTYMDEERAFLMLHILMKKYNLESLYLPGLEELKKKFYVLLNLEKKFIPDCYKIFVRDDISPRCYASEWFISLFARNLDFNILVRIFDTFLLEEFKVIYRFALAFIKLKEDELLEAKTVDSTFIIMGNCLKNVNIDELWKIAFRFRISKKNISNYEKEYEKVKDDSDNEFMKQIL